MLLVWILISFALLLDPAAARAQAHPARIGIIGPSEEPRFSELVGGLKQGLRDLGYTGQLVELVEGKLARGDRAGLKSLVEGFIRQRARLLFVVGSEMARQTRQVSSETPILFITPGDPVASGLLLSLARPGRNMTAVTFEYPELLGKRLELLREINPRLRRVLVVYDPSDASPRQGVEAARKAAAQLGMTLIERPSTNPEEIAQALASLSQVDGLLCVPGGFPSGHYREMILIANSQRVPTIFHARTQSTMEALASYGANDAEVAREAARLVVKILRGANAGELPVERPTKLELIINLKTAKALGVKIPAHLLMEADRVIE